jgi:hypothetical protein
LVPVFLSQNFTAACRAANPHFLWTLPHGSKTVDEFSEQMKREITDKLPAQEAATVVLVAANMALRAARNEMYKLSQSYPAWVQKPLSRWCDDEAQPYILDVMQKDQREHEKLLAIIEKAKQ